MMKNAILYENPGDTSGNFKPSISNIPDELKTLPQWVFWIEAPNPKPDKKPLKILVDPKTGKAADSTNPDTWASFEEAQKMFKQRGGQKHRAGGYIGIIKGVGFVFTKDDPYIGIDLDYCIDPEGVLLSWADEVVERFDSYTEKSISETGLHVLIKGKKPGDKCKKGDVECYSQKRFFAITRDDIGGRDKIHSRRGELDWFYNKFFGSNGKPKQQKPQHQFDFKTTVDTETALDRARRSKNGSKIEQLLSGDNAGLPSDSEGDQALCNHLVFFCGNIPDSETESIVDAFVRQSGRYRKKWDEKHFSDGRTYGQATIAKAIDGTPKRYQTRNERVIKETAKVAELFSSQELIGAAYDGQKGAANLFIKLFKDRFVFDHTDGVWYEWQEHFWQAEDIGRPVKECDQIQQALERVQAELDGEVVLIGQKIKTTTDANEAEKLKSELARVQGQQKAVSGSIKNLNTLAFRKAVIEFAAQGEGSLGISGTEWDLKPWMLPCKNGVIDLKTGDLKPGKPKDYLKSVCPTDYDPQAFCPQFERALLDIFNNDLELFAFWQRVAGMALVGSNVEHVLIVLHGKGRNGKDVLLSTFGNVLGGSLAGAVQSELLLDQGRAKASSGPSADVMRLRGLRLAWASETNEGRRMDAGKIKLLTGGGDLVGRAPYARREVSFPQSFCLFLLTNAKPHASADDYALWKRIKLVPFEVQFVDDPTGLNEKQRDKGLLEKLKTEAPGILCWMVEGCLEWQSEGLNPPAAVEQATNQYRDEEDLLLQFVEDACTTGPDQKTGASNLYNHYKTWMQDNGLRPMSGQKFGRKMGERFHRFRYGSVWNYEGIQILLEQDAEHAEY